MNMEEKDPTKSMDWKVIEEPVSSDPNPSSDPAVKKRLPRRMRQIPEFYFLPRRSIPYNLAFYGAWIAGGIGAGMVIETWINKKVKALGATHTVIMIEFLLLFRRRLTPVPKTF